MKAARFYRSSATIREYMLFRFIFVVFRITDYTHYVLKEIFKNVVYSSQIAPLNPTSTLINQYINVFIKIVLLSRVSEKIIPTKYTLHSQNTPIYGHSANYILSFD